MARSNYFSRRRRTLRRSLTRRFFSGTIRSLSGLFGSGSSRTMGDDDSVSFRGSSFDTAADLFEQGFGSLFTAGLGLLTAREKTTTVVGESARSQELQSQFNLSRSQRAALLTEATQRGERNL